MHGAFPISHRAVSRANESEVLPTAALTRALSNVAILDVSSGGTIGFASARAAALLAKYFPDVSPRRLPAELLHWVRLEKSRAARLTFPHIMHSPTEHLAARLSGKMHGRFQILLEERSCREALQRLESLGLTSREAEVLLWIMRGKAAVDIATILGCSTRTVSKHTERILDKLHVETRTAAAAIAREVVG